MGTFRRSDCEFVWKLLFALDALTSGIGAGAFETRKHLMKNFNITPPSAAHLSHGSMDQLQRFVMPESSSTSDANVLNCNL